MTVEITEKMVAAAARAGSLELLPRAKVRAAMETVAPEIERAVTIKIAERLGLIANHAEHMQIQAGVAPRSPAALILEDLINRIDVLRESLDGLGEPDKRHYHYPMEGEK